MPCAPCNSSTRPLPARSNVEAIEIAITTPSGYRSSEMVADLRNAAEVLYFPMRAVGYWDVRSRDHRCPQASLGKPCPHLLARDDPRFVDYMATVERDLDAVIDVYFPHAQVHVYMA